MRDGVGKGFQLMVGGLEFGSASAEFLVEFANFFLAMPALLHLDLQGVAGLPKVVLDPASNLAERGDNGRPCEKNQEVGQVSGGNAQRIKRLGEEVVEQG